jgi:hypothetical protein
LILYLVVGENNVIRDGMGWSICGLFKDSSNAWSCPVLDKSGNLFDHRVVVEIQTDFDEEDIRQISKEKSRMLRIEKWKKE